MEEVRRDWDKPGFDEIHDEEATEQGKPVSANSDAAISLESSPPVFEHDGRVGQFTIPLAAFSLAPHLARAVFNVIWPISVKQVATEQGPQLHVIGFCELFRKLDLQDGVPPYAFHFEDSDAGIKVTVEELPLPEQKHIVVPANRSARRQAEKMNGR